MLCCVFLQDGATAFYHAATRGLYDVVKALIHRGVEIDSAVTNDPVSTKQWLHTFITIALVEGDPHIVYLETLVVEAPVCVCEGRGLCVRRLRINQSIGSRSSYVCFHLFSWAEHPCYLPVPVGMWMLSAFFLNMEQTQTELTK